MHIVNYMDTMIHVFDVFGKLPLENEWGLLTGFEINIPNENFETSCLMIFNDLVVPIQKWDTVTARAGWLRACKPTRTGGTWTGMSATRGDRSCSTLW